MSSEVEGSDLMKPLGDKDGQVFHATESQKRNAFEWLRDLALSGAHGSWTAGVLLREIVELKAARSSCPPLSVRMIEARESNGNTNYAVFLGRPSDGLLDCHQVYSDTIKGRAEYERDRLKHFLGQGPEPDILAYATDAPRPESAPSTLLMSHVNDPSNFNPTDEFDGLQFGTQEDAKKAAFLFNRILSERDTAVSHANGLTDLIRRMEAKHERELTEEKRKLLSGEEIWRGASKGLLLRAEKAEAALSATTPTADEPFEPDEQLRSDVAKALEEVPFVQSLLYDLDLLPEQIRDKRRYQYMLCVISHMKEAQRSSTTPAWQPMETAPKNDTIILSDGERVTPGGWFEDQFEEGTLVQSAGWWILDGGEMSPTCWMPMPKAQRSAIPPISNA